MGDIEHENVRHVLTVPDVRVIQDGRKDPYIKQTSVGPVKDREAPYSRISRVQLRHWPLPTTESPKEIQCKRFVPSRM